MKLLRIYINGFTNRMLSIPQSSNIGNWLCLVRGDYGIIEAQLVNNDNPQIAGDGTAAAADVFSLADIVSGRFGIKLYSDVAAAGDWQQSFATFDTTQAWHVLASGRVALPYYLRRALDPTLQFVCGLDFSATLTTRGHMTDLPINLSLLADLDTGTEATGPTGPASGEVDGTILAGNDSVVLTATGMTATGRALPSFLGAPISTISATCGKNTITVQLGGPAPVDTAIMAFILRNA